MTPLELLERCFREVPHGGAAEEEARLPRRLWERALLGPAREFLRRPGKGLRGRLVEAGWDLAGGAPGAVPPELPALVELLHAGSLILDDVQDGSAERRGAPALHRVCGTAVAINTASWMVFWPIQILGQALGEAAAAEARRRVTAALVSCHQGQALDLALPAHELEPAELAEVVAMSTRLRTASLTELSAGLGALAAGGAQAAQEELGALGREIGVALQMLDDLGGVVADERRAKGEEDLRLARPTWVWAWAAEVTSGAQLAALRAHGREVAGGADPAPLRARLAAAVAELGRARARGALAAVRARASARFAGSPALAALTGDLALLEQSYG